MVDANSNKVVYGSAFINIIKNRTKAKMDINEDARFNQD